MVVLVAKQKRKMLCKPEKVIHSQSQYAGLLFFNPFTFAAREQISRLVTMGNQSPESVDEAVSGNQFHCNYKNEIISYNKSADTDKNIKIAAYCV